MTDKLLFGIVMVLACSGLAYSYGHQHGREVAPCPKYDGHVAAYSIMQQGKTMCVYVPHVRGLAMSVR